MFKPRRLVSLLAATCLAIPPLVACGGSDSGSSTSAPAGDQEIVGNAPTGDDPPAPKLFTRNVVVFNEDGSQTVHFSYITRAEQLEEQAVRRKAIEAAQKGGEQVLDSLTNDSCTNAADILLYDVSNEGGDEICFRNTHGSAAVADLSIYQRSSARCAGDCNFFTENWYGPVLTDYDTCTGGASSNYVKSIMGEYPGDKTPGGCFNESSTGVGTPGNNFFNFSLQGTSENTGSSLTNYRYLWLDNDRV
jgi:hypothetical protein